MKTQHEKLQLFNRLIALITKNISEQYSFNTPKAVTLASLKSSGRSGLAAEYWTRDRQGAGSTLSWSTASNLEQVANLLCAQANSASYPQQDGK